MLNQVLPAHVLVVRNAIQFNIQDFHCGNLYKEEGIMKIVRFHRVQLLLKQVCLIIKF